MLDRDMLGSLFVLLALSVATGFILRMIALKRGNNGWRWFWIGLLVGPLALVCIPFIKQR